MTHRLDTTRSTGQADHPRCQLTPHSPTSMHLGGAWWPRSTQLTAELPALVTALSGRLGELAVVGYHRNAWTPAPEQLHVAGETIALQGFTSDEPATVILICRDGRCVTLQVIPPAANGAVARGTLDAAARDTSDGDVGTDSAGEVTARSVREVAAQLAHHEGRADPLRTAQIARWCDEAAEQFTGAPIQAFVPILVHHVVRNRMGTRRPRSEAQRS